MFVTILTPQDMPECRWCQPQFVGRRNGEEDLASAPWECIRIPGQEHPISDIQCAGCEHWESDYTF